MTQLTKFSRSVTGNVALVTGIASGIGRAFARVFVDEGLRVAMADVNAEHLTRAVDEIKETGHEV